MKKIDEFNDIYNTTYNNVLKFIIVHCNNFEDVNDLVQDTYLELYKVYNKKKINEIENISAYVIGIARNVINKYYRLKYIRPTICENKYNEEFNDFNFDIELQFITKENVEEVWNYIRNKDIIVAKIFYCYYYLDMKICDISKEMQLNESTVKNYIYRTIKEIKQNLKKESDENV